MCETLAAAAAPMENLSFPVEVGRFTDESSARERRLSMSISDKSHHRWISRSGSK